MTPLLYSCNTSDSENLERLADITKGKDVVITQLRSDLSELDRTFRGYQFTSQNEKDSLIYLIENLTSRINGKVDEIKQLQNNINNSSNDEITTTLITELQEAKTKLEELLFEEQNLTASLKRKIEDYENKLTSIGNINYEYANIKLKLKKIDEDITFHLTKAEKLTQLPNEIALDLKNQVTEVERLSDSSKLHTEQGFEILLTVLKNDLNLVETHLNELEKKIDHKYFIVNSKKELRRRNILNKNQPQTWAITEGNYQIVSRKTTLFKILTENRNDSPEVMSNQPKVTYELSRESDKVWNLYITNPMAFWSNSPYLIVAY